MKRILLTRTDRLGDVVLSTPVIRFMRKKFPDAYIAFIVRPETRDILSRNPDLDEVIVYDKYGRHRSLAATIRFALSIRKKRFDTAIALHPTARVHLTLFIAGIPERIGYNRKLGFLLTRSAPHVKHEGVRHESDYNFDLIRLAGIEVDGYDKRPYIVTGTEDRKMIDALWRSFALTDNVIAVHAGASCRSKRWAPESFAKAADALSDEYGAAIVLVGGDETEAFSEQVALSMRTGPVDLTGQLLLGELAELLSRCRLFLSNDSGPVHVAAAVGTPCVVIFGRSDPGLSPARWGPLGEKDIVIHRDTGCRPCLAHECENDVRCLKAVSFEEVVEAVRSILG